MNAKKLLIGCTGIIFAFTIGSCEKEITDSVLTSNAWKVVKIKKEDSASYLKTSNTYILEFVSDSSFIINFDVNDCGGPYKITSNHSIEIQDLYCTQVCCDSDFANDMGLILSKVTSYFGFGNELILYGEGEIHLKRN